MAARDAEKLIEELYHNANAAAGKPLERRMADLTIWFYKNRGTIDALNLAARQAFLEKAFWILIETMALSLERLHELEDRGRPKGLWTVGGLAMRGDVRKFG